ncbi:MAG: adenylate/guanylate cyclase domain-containing protein [Methylotenera sp.]|nr:MAG: adenylate/guanylate cyclase domain-containing protein [Methylotenera sp.]PPD18380.1 MAG: adenylate/guanylate cyclase domain-containing protein [Methylotenera sp.]
MSVSNPNRVLGITTREFWHNISHPTDASLGKAILTILVFAESLVCIFWIFTLSGLGEGYALMAAVPYAYVILSYASLLIFYRTKKFEYFTFTQLVMLLVMPFFMQWAIGGYEASSGIAIWAILSPIGALMILGTKQSTPWFILFAFLAGLSWKLNYLFAGNSLPIPSHIKDTFFLMNIMGTACILYAVMRYFQSQKERTLHELELEQARSEKLLLNILPKSIASRLKDNDMRIADSHEAVTILFADIVDFTKMTATMPPAELVDLLSQLFSRFDHLADQYGLEKIKTIGDGYMVVGGAPVYLDDHANVIAQLALQMQEELELFNQQIGKQLQMRIGISSGPVVAGVIGTSKFAYDIWGDPVNMASRMEKNGLPGTIQVSECTYNLLKTQHTFESRGPIPIKGKGDVNTYFLKS